MKQPHEMRPGNRYARQAQARRTLGDLIANKSALVAICQGCKHRRLLFPAVLASRLGESFLVVDLSQHLRCAECKRHRTARVYLSTLSHTETVPSAEETQPQTGSDLHQKFTMFRASRGLP